MDETENLLPWQKEDWVDPYARYNELSELSDRIMEGTLIMLRDRLEVILKEEKLPHDWAKEGF